MKGPHDEDVSIESGIEATSKGARPREKVPGGKALQRLLQFVEERDLPLLSEEDTEPGTPAKKGKSKSSRAASKKSSATPEPGSDYAEEMMAATNALQPEGPPTESATAEMGVISMSAPTGSGPQWRFLGPTVMLNGQTYGDTRVPVSGRVSCIAVDPSNSNHILCGSAGGGVWESRDNGVNWAPRTDYMPTCAVGALAFNPLAPNTVYCGTGEGNFYASLGVGVLRSTDGGTTWAVHATNPFVGQGFYDLIIDRANTNHLLAATTGGVYESADGGLTWTNRRNQRCWDLAMAPAGGASAEVLAACSDGLFRSTNGGSTYAKVNLPGGPASYNRLAVAISRSNPAIAYAFGANGANAFLYQRSAAGTWTLIGNPPGLSTGQAWYDWFLEISTDNSNQIYLGAIEAYRGTLSGTSWTWVTISNKAGDDIHPDQHAIAIDPANANIIYVGCDGGLFRSPNRGTNWTSLNNGLGITEIEYMAQDLGTVRWLMAGTQDNGTTLYTGSGVCNHIADGDGGDCAVNTVSPDNVFHSYFYMGLDRSTNKGNTWSWMPNASRDPNVYGQLFYPPVEGRGSTIAQAGESVYISRNNLATGWTTQVALPGRPVASAMYLPNADRIYVGTTNGRIFRIVWSGTAWSAATELTSPRTGAYISDIFVDPTNLNRIWVTSTSRNGGRVFRSDNGGTSWTDLSAGLPNLPINAIEVHPDNANRVWVAADVGVYQSFDTGATWSAFANGLPNALAVDLLYHHHARVLRVGMRNRGVWEIPVDGLLTAPICGVQWNGALSPNQTQSWFTFNWPATWHVIWTIMPTTPAPGAKVTWKVAVERSSSEFVTYWITVTNLTNQTVNFEGRYAILSFY